MSPPSLLRCSLSMICDGGCSGIGGMSSRSSDLENEGFRRELVNKFSQMRIIYKGLVKTVVRNILLT